LVKLKLQCHCVLIGLFSLLGSFSARLVKLKLNLSRIKLRILPFGGSILERLCKLTLSADRPEYIASTVTQGTPTERIRSGGPVFERTGQLLLIPVQHP
jgi:hypothetical protein